MYVKNLIAIMCIVFSSITVSAQISFNTGSTQLDADLNIINDEARKDLPEFKANMKLEFGVESKVIDEMFSIKMEPGEVFLALEIAKITSKPADNVVKSYQANKDKGWGAIAKDMGIKPGSKEFHELKNMTTNAKGKDKSANKGKGQSKGKGKGKKK